MNTSGITAALPAQDLGRAKAFYVGKVGLQALQSHFLDARDGQVGLTVGVFQADEKSSGASDPLQIGEGARQSSPVPAVPRSRQNEPR